MTLKPIRDHVLLLENATPQTDGVLLGGSIWSPFLDYVVLRAPDGADYGPGDRVVLRFAESGRKVSVGGMACRVAAAEDVLAIVEEQ